ncbi:MAG: hypothetical protein OEL89_01600, partial [Candidatus Peregrinibacteria bacterium]|nr:hypothetical protein [Candidatus Peregrinibacteria bacterium]
MMKTPLRSGISGKKLALFAGILLVSVVVFWKLVSVVLSGTDGDGLIDSLDNFPNAAIETPSVLSPVDDETVVTTTGDVTISGVAEIDTEIHVFESTTDLCNDTVTGSGSVADGNYNGTQLVPAISVVDETFFKPTSGFPARSILIAEINKVSVFDVEDTSSAFLEIAVADVQAVFGYGSTIYVATSSGGVKTFDSTGSSSGDYTTGSSPAINNNNVADLFVALVNTKVYIVAATASGVSVINETDNTSVSKATTAPTSISITKDENKILYSTGANTYLSNLPVNTVSADFAVTDYTTTVNFNSGSTSEIIDNFVGHSAGFSELFSGSGFVRNVTKDYATSPMFTGTIGHWSNNVTDRSGVSNDLTNNGGVTISAVDTGADLQQFTFNGTSNYLSSASTDFNVSGDKLSVGMWIKRPTDGGTGTYQKIMTHGESESSRNYWLSMGDSFFDYPVEYDPYSFGVQTSNGAKGVFVYDYPPATNTWEFVVGVYDGAQIKIYLNGVLENSIAHSGNITNLAEDLRIGYGYGTEYFEGNIALPFVMNQDLAIEDVQRIYDMTSNWFATNATITLGGTSDAVSDISCDSDRAECTVATGDGITRVSSYTGLTNVIDSGTAVSNVTQTYMGTWSCVATSMPSSSETTVFAKAYYNGNASSVISENVSFAVVSSVDDGDGDGIPDDIDPAPGVPILTPVISSPVHNSQTTETIVPIVGTGDPSTQIRVFNESDSSVLCTADIDGAGDWSCTPSEFGEAEYFIHATAYVGVVASNVDSSTTRFVVDTTPTAPPVLNALPTYTASTTVAPSWNTVTDATQYRIEMDNANDFLSLEADSGWISPTTYNFDNLSNGDVRYFRVKARDAAGNESLYSNIESTTIDVVVPVAGTVTNDDGNYSTDTTVAFSWSGFSDALSGLDHYELQIDDAVDFATPVIDNANFSLTTTSYVGTSGETYYARVKGVDAAGLKTDWVQSAGTLIDTTAPAAFTVNSNTSPSPNTTQTISWVAATDGESGIAQYELFKKTMLLNDTLVEDFVSIGTTTGLSRDATGLENDRKYNFKVVATNNAGTSTESTNTIEIIIDTSAPAAPSWENVNNYSKVDSFTIDWVAATDVSGIDHYEVYRNGSLVQYVTAPTTQWTDNSGKADANVYEYLVRAVDGANNNGSFSSTLRVLVDKSLPITSESLAGTAGDNGWYTSAVTVSLTPSDPGVTLFEPATSSGSGFYAGVSSTLYNLDSGGDTAYSVPVLISSNGAHTFDFYSTDVATNLEATNNFTVSIDDEAPTALFSAQNIDPTADNGFTTEGAITFIATGSDGVSGVASVITSVKFDQNGDGLLSGTNDFDYTQIASSNGTLESYTMTLDGKYDFRVITTDVAGNSTTSSIVVVKRDATAPVTTDNIPSGVQTSAFTITLSPTDQAVSSGVYQTWYTTDGSDPTTSGTRVEGISTSSNNISVSEDSFFTMRYYSIDGMGNAESIKSGTNQVILDTDSDYDNDGMSNDCENAYGLDPLDATDASEDPDGDTLTNLEECQYQTNPNLADTDSDSVNDNVEISDGTSPADDTDHRVVVTAPVSGVATDVPFAFIGTAPPNKLITLKNAGGTTIGTGTSGSAGTLEIEITLPVGTNIISAQFEGDSGTIITPNISVLVSLSGLNPHYTNVSEGSSLAPSLSEVLINGTPAATIELFQI